MEQLNADMFMSVLSYCNFLLKPFAFCKMGSAHFPFFLCVCVALIAAHLYAGIILVVTV